jgi:hypothetical protein
MRFIKVVVKLKGGLQKMPSGEWRSRRVLTADEAALLGKKALTKATGTEDYTEARRIGELHLAEFERLIAEARGDHLSPLDKLLRDNPHLRFAPLDEIADAGMEVGIDDLFTAPPNTPIKEPVTFATLLATWELENTNKRTRRIFGRYMERFAEHLGHHDANRVTPENFIGFKEQLLKAANAKEMSHTTVGNILTAIRAVFASGHKARKIEANPTTGITYRAKKSQKGKTLPYTREQVRLILTKGREQPPYFRYPTLIGAFSGARIGELADATTHDIYQVDGIWVVDICTDFRDEGQRIKTQSSIRRVPLHPQIIGEGFIEYVRSLSPGPLFPAFSLGQDNRRADAASREISEWVRSLGIENPSKTVRYKPHHSFRHYCKTEWRNAKVEEELHDAITGHGSDSESRQYGEYELRLMLDAIEKLPNPLVQGGGRLG